MPEIWRSVVGWEGRYEVSDLGNVRRGASRAHGARPGRPRAAGAPNPRTGYHSVTLWRNNKSTTLAIHILVCTAFHGPKPTPRHEVNHKDWNKSNNRADNLEWATPAGNNNHSRRHK